MVMWKPEIEVKEKVMGLEMSGLCQLHIVMKRAIPLYN